MSSYAYDKFFPFQQVRPHQAKAIEFALDTFLSSGKRFCVLELPVGVGKSATGLTIARYLLDRMEGESTGAYFLTTQKVLQDQYERDFGPHALGLLRSIKSSSNYTCAYHPDRACSDARRLLSYLKDAPEASDFKKVCTSSCPYAKAKSSFVQSSMGVTNFSYFLSETTYAKKLEPRHLLVIDEAHNTELELSKFIEVVFSEKFAKDVLKCRLPADKSQQSIFDWVKSTYLSGLKKHAKKAEKELRKLSIGGKDAHDESRRLEVLEKHTSKVEKFLESYDPTNWVMNVSLPVPGTKAGKKFEFKPVNVSKYSDDILFKYGERVVLMSATILNKSAFCRSLGLPDDQTSFLSLPSPFPPENRLVHFLPVGSMSKSRIDSTLPKMVGVVEEILRQHASEKGIIHATNYRIAKYLHENLKSSRVLIHDSTNRDKVLKRHVESPEPTVLLSPSMMEGVDLADDASRFQVVCKVPFPYLGDALVQQRMRLDESWYPYQTAKLMIQSLGRSIRNERDHATSYILDSDWEAFYSRNKQMFPDDFSSVLR